MKNLVYNYSWLNILRKFVIKVGSFQHYCRMAFELKSWLHNDIRQCTRYAVASIKRNHFSVLLVLENAEMTKMMKIEKGISNA